MFFISSRNADVKVSSSFAIAHGISKEGGLFLPEIIPTLKENDFNNLCAMSYVDRAASILKKYLTDFTDEEIDNCVKSAYIGSFDNDEPAPLVNLGGNIQVLELWHGPTCAFKDLALQLLPHLMTNASKKTGDGKKIVILVATSGDTGKAALEGFKDVKDTEIIVFYPSEGVSPTQKLQMASQEGSNVYVYGIKGNFDDAQTGVKKIFTDSNIIKQLNENGFEFSSANSINWGRLVPQIVYYISAYCDMLNRKIDLSGGFNITVPTGNFGNILAAYFARAMGVPIKKLICASNKNKVLTDFINTGVYNKIRDFYTTISPSMDILISSNLERMLYILSGDDKYVANLQDKLQIDGGFEVNDTIKAKLREIFYAGYCDDDKTLETIARVYKDFGYLCDTHTAVAVAVAKEYIENSGDNAPMIIASTASPYKFATNVLSAISDEVPKDDFSAIRKLSEVTGVKVPKPISDLFDKKVRFNKTIDKSELKNAVFECLKL